MVKLSVWSSKYTPAAVWAHAASCYSPLIKGFEKKTTAPVWHVLSRSVSFCPADILHSDVPKAFLCLFTFCIGGCIVRNLESSSVFSVFCGNPSLSAVMSLPLRQSVCHAGSRLVECSCWVSTNEGAENEWEREGEGPVEQVYDVCVIWHCTSTPILCC